jgi:hypothetical protein
MEGNIVTAARWLGASMIAASAILVGGIHWTLSRPAGRLAATASAPASPPAPTAAPALVGEPVRSDMEELARVFRNQGKDAAVARAGAESLLKQSESLRTTGEEWDRFWFKDPPERLPPFRSSPTGP